jgi:hypothetical protein
LVLVCAAGCADVATRPETAVPVTPVAVRPLEFSPDLVLLLTGGGTGRLEMCDCGGPQPGGLARRMGLLASYRAAVANSVTLDVGDAFWISPDPVRHEYLLRGLALLKYDALVMGEQEWITPPGQWQSLQRPGLPLLSGNVASRTGFPAVADVLRIPAGTGCVSILSYTPDDAFLLQGPDVLGPLVRGGLDVLAGQVRRQTAAGDAVGVVVHGSDDAARQVATEVDGVDFVIRGHTARTGESADLASGAPIVTIGGPEYVGVLALRIENGRVAQLQWRAEVVDDAWPADLRLVRLFEDYLRAAGR